MQVKEYVVIPRGFGAEATTPAELALICCMAAKHYRETGSPTLAARADRLSDYFHDMRDSK